MPIFGNAAVSKSPAPMASEITAANQEFVENAFQRGERRIILRERRAELGAFGGLFQNGSAGVDDDGFARAAPDGEVGGGIAGVIKTAFAEFFDEDLEFVRAAQIGFAVAAQHFVKQPDMIGDGQGHVAVGGGGENQFPAGGFLFAQKGEERFVIGQGGGINRDAPDELLFQESPAARPPEQNGQKLERIPPQQPRERFPEQIGLDERAVQIHDRAGFDFGRPSAVAAWVLINR